MSQLTTPSKPMPWTVKPLDPLRIKAGQELYDTITEDRNFSSNEKDAYVAMYLSDRLDTGYETVDNAIIGEDFYGTADLDEQFDKTKLKMQSQFEASAGEKFDKLPLETQLTAAKSWWDENTVGRTIREDNLLTAYRGNVVSSSVQTNLSMLEKQMGPEVLSFVDTVVGNENIEGYQYNTFDRFTPLQKQQALTAINLRNPKLATGYMGRLGNAITEGVASGWEGFSGFVRSTLGQTIFEPRNVAEDLIDKGYKVSDLYASDGKMTEKGKQIIWDTRQSLAVDEDAPEIAKAQVYGQTRPSAGFADSLYGQIEMVADEKTKYVIKQAQTKKYLKVEDDGIIGWVGELPIMAAGVVPDLAVTIGLSAVAPSMGMSYMFARTHGSLHANLRYNFQVPTDEAYGMTLGASVLITATEYFQINRLLPSTGTKGLASAIKKNSGKINGVLQKYLKQGSWGKTTLIEGTQEQIQSTIETATELIGLFGYTDADSEAKKSRAHDMVADLIKEIPLNYGIMAQISGVSAGINKGAISYKKPQLNTIIANAVRRGDIKTLNVLEAILSGTGIATSVIESTINDQIKAGKPVVEMGLDIYEELDSVSSETLDDLANEREHNGKNASEATREALDNLSDVKIEDAVNVAWNTKKDIDSFKKDLSGGKYSDAEIDTLADALVERDQTLDEVNKKIDSDTRNYNESADLFKAIHLDSTRVKQSIEKAIPNSVVSINKQTLTITLPNNNVINIGLGKEVTGDDRGVYIPFENLILLERGSATESTVFHELFHALEAGVLSATDIKILEKEGLDTEEKRADAFVDYMTSKGVKQHTRFGKIRNVLRKITGQRGILDVYNTLRTAEDIDITEYTSKDMLLQKGHGRQNNTELDEQHLFAIALTHKLRDGLDQKDSGTYLKELSEFLSIELNETQTNNIIAEAVVSVAAANKIGLPNTLAGLKKLSDKRQAKNAIIERSSDIGLDVGNNILQVLRPSKLTRDAKREAIETTTEGTNLYEPVTDPITGETKERILRAYPELSELLEHIEDLDNLTLDHQRQIVKAFVIEAGLGVDHGIQDMSKGELLEFLEHDLKGIIEKKSLQEYSITKLDEMDAQKSEGELKSINETQRLIQQLIGRSPATVIAQHIKRNSIETIIKDLKYTAQQELGSDYKLEIGEGVTKQDLIQIATKMQNDIAGKDSKQQRAGLLDTIKRTTESATESGPGAGEQHQRLTRLESVRNMSADEITTELIKIIETINKNQIPSNIANPDKFMEGVHRELENLSLVGNLKSKTYDELKHVASEVGLLAKGEQTQGTTNRLANEKEYAKDVQLLLDGWKDKKNVKDKPGAGQIAKSFLAQHLSLEDLMDYLTISKNRKTMAAMRKITDKIITDNNVAYQRTRVDDFNNTNNLNEALETAYGVSPEQALADLEKPIKGTANLRLHDSKGHVTNEGIDLTKSGIISTLLTLQDPNYAYLLSKDYLPDGFTIEKLESYLSGQDKVFINFIKKSLAGAKEKVAQTSQEVLGINPVIGNWAGKFVGDKIGLAEQHDILNITANFMGTQPIHGRVVNQDISFIEIYNDTMHAAARFNNYSKWIKETRAIFGNQEIRQMITAKFGGKAETLINELITDIARGRGKGEHVEFLDKAMQLFSSLKLGLNLSVAVGQQASIFAFGLHKNFKLRDTIPNFRYLKTIYSDPRMKARRSQGQTQIMSDILESGSSKSKLRVAIEKALMQPTLHGDALAIAIGGSGFYSRMRAAGMSHDQAMDKLMQITEPTQQSSDIAQLSHFQRRGGSFGRAFGMFSNTVRAYLSKEVVAISELLAVKDYKSLVRAGNVIGINHVILPLVYMYLKRMAAVILYDPDEDWLNDKEKQRALQAAITGPFGSLIFAGAVVEVVTGAASHAAMNTGKKSTTFGNSIVPIAGLLDDTARIMRLLQEGDLGDDVINALEASPALKAFNRGLVERYFIDTKREKLRKRKERKRSK